MKKYVLIAYNKKSLITKARDYAEGDGEILYEDYDFKRVQSTFNVFKNDTELELIECDDKYTQYIGYSMCLSDLVFKKGTWNETILQTNRGCCIKEFTRHLLAS